jgi:cytochrome P450
MRTNLITIFSIGNQFSLVEQTVFISALLQRFKWVTLDSVRADFSGVSVRYFAEVYVELNSA